LTALLILDYNLNDGSPKSFFGVLGIPAWIAICAQIGLIYYAMPAGRRAQWAGLVVGFVYVKNWFTWAVAGFLTVIWEKWAGVWP
jgi:hypothetical protein